MHRTTIRLSDALLRRVKRLAADTGRTFTTVVTDALEAALDERERPRRRRRIKLKTFRGTGLKRGINLDDGARLRDLMEGLDGPA